jgi:hypothetical protein
MLASLRGGDTCNGDLHGLRLKWCRSKLGLVCMEVDTGMFDRLYDNGVG